MKNFTKEEREKMYIDWVNNFLTVGAFADYYGIGDNEARQLIEGERKKLYKKDKMHLVMKAWRNSTSAYKRDKAKRYFATQSKA